MVLVFFCTIHLFKYVEYLFVLVLAFIVCFGNFLWFLFNKCIVFVVGLYVCWQIAAADRTCMLRGLQLQIVLENKLNCILFFIKLEFILYFIFVCEYVICYQGYSREGHAYQSQLEIVFLNNLRFVNANTWYFRKVKNPKIYQMTYD